MDRKRVPGAENRAYGTGCRKKRAIGPALVERDGWWWVNGTLREAGRSRLIRKSTGVRATDENKAAAQKEFDRIINIERAKLNGQIVHVPATVACDQFLDRGEPVAYRV